MRVFKNYMFNLKDKVEFKNTLEYIDKFLQENNIVYDNIAFMFESGNNTKIINTYPALLKYRKNENDMSSVSNNWKVNGLIHVDKTDEYLIKEISHKIPRPFKFGFIRIVYDNVHWHDDINKMPALNGDNAPDAIFTDMHQSNAIEVKKQFDYGKNII